MLLLILLLTPLFCGASHFEGGTITYKVLNTSGTTVSILIQQTYIYVYPSIYCDDSYIINQSPKLNMSGRGENGKYLNCTANCSTAGGYVPVPLNPYCSDYSSVMNVTIGERTDVVNLSIGSYFTVAFVSNTWRPLTLPPGASASKGWSIACTIDLRLRSDGTLNNPPVATMISPIYIPVGVAQTIFIPTIDADNDQVRCRFANSSTECSDVCPPASLPNGTTLLSNCTLFITGTNINDWYAVAIVIEDFINSTSVSPLSSVPVQFLINVQNRSSCLIRPLLTGPSSQTSQCVGVQVGQAYTIELIAQNYCPLLTTIKDIATISFPIVSKTPIVQNTTTIWSVSLTWTPTASSIGSQVLCAVAIDSANVQSNQYCMTFTVAQGSVPSCPGQTETTTQSMPIISGGSLSSVDSTLADTSFQLDTSSSSITYDENSEHPTYESSTFYQKFTVSTGNSTLILLSTADMTTSSMPSSPSGSSVLPLWLTILLPLLALLSIALCIGCCCCLLHWLCCSPERRRKKSLSEDFPQQAGSTSSSVCSFVLQQPSENLTPITRPSSADPSEYTDDIQLTIRCNPRTEPMPHYLLPLRRSARVAPSPSLSLSTGSISSRVTITGVYLFDS